MYCDLRQHYWWARMKRDIVEFVLQYLNYQQFLPLAKFTCNNSYHSNIDMAPFEALYGRRCRSPIGRFDAFEIRPWGFVKGITQKGVMRFGKKGKLSPRFIGPFEILSPVGEVAYELSLPPGLSGVHPVFYVSMLKRYHGDGSYIIHWDSVLLDESVFYEEEPIAILDRGVGKLRSKDIASVKVQWKNRPVEEATWEFETEIRNKYP
ncbi:uncharacterized protein LOC132031634 [Lycium ferocissimum]|uniref:uncharacterized protein LOC132031634 n=1 Tax=Lycium ferocissimum TaxID=112874 RepID=UPI002816360A|nr:uncharacterized protein LOC132031634 [Lycium ferocissimum]